MNILYELDNNFAPQVCASMASVCENNADVANLHFYVFGLGLDRTVSQNLSAVGARYGREVTIIPIDGFMDDFGDFDTFGWNEVVMGRLLLARFLPKEVERVLYLDGDTIVRGSLAPLGDYCFAPHMILGAVVEATVDRRRLPSLELQNEPYFNSGVLLIDVAKWRIDHAEERILAYCRKHEDQIVAPDQDAINGALRGQIDALPPTYNYCNSYEFYPYRTLLGLMEGVPYYREHQVDEAKADPKIVHYLGEERPWRAGNTHTYRDDYKHYLALTPYANTPDDTGWGAYFAAWRVFNVLTKPCPGLRYRVMTILIPKVLALRAAKRKKGFA